MFANAVARPPAAAEPEQIRILRIAENAVRAAWSLWQEGGPALVDQAHGEVTRALLVWQDARAAVAGARVAPAEDVRRIAADWWPPRL